MAGSQEPDRHPEPPKVLVVLNPAARGDPSGLLGEVERVCRDSGFEPVTVAPTGPEAATSEIRAALTEQGPWSALVAVGGDGTVGTCAEATVGTDVPVAIVPGGTGNSLYRALWEDRPWPGVLSVALDSTDVDSTAVDSTDVDSTAVDTVGVRYLDLLRVTGGTSAVTATALLGVSAGLVAEVVGISEGLTGVSGRERYSVATGPALETHVAFPARIHLDGTLLTDAPVSLVAVGGARHRAGTFELLPRSVLDDGLLDVCVIGGLDADGFVELAGAVVAGDHIGRPGVDYGQGRSVTIERSDGEALALECDGDTWPAAERSVTIEVAGLAVAMLAPLTPVAG